MPPIGEAYNAVQNARVGAELAYLGLPETRPTSSHGTTNTCATHRIWSLQVVDGQAEPVPSEVELCVHQIFSQGTVCGLFSGQLCCPDLGNRARCLYSIELGACGRYLLARKPSRHLVKGGEVGVARA